MAEQDGVLQPLFLDRRTPPGRYSARRGHRHVTDDAGAVGRVPRDVTSKSKHFVTELFHVHLQQALPNTALSKQYQYKGQIPVGR